MQIIQLHKWFQVAGPVRAYVVFIDFTVLNSAVRKDAQQAKIKYKESANERLKFDHCNYIKYPHGGSKTLDKMVLLGNCGS